MFLSSLYVNGECLPENAVGPLVAPVKDELRIPMAEEQKQLFGIDRFNVPRSQIPAITHVDYSARVQTVHRDTNPRYYDLLKHFEERTGCAVLVNTSLNVRGEPIVSTLSCITTPVIMSLVFFLVITPSALYNAPHGSRPYGATV